jgi:ankyrin repeat protein
MLIKSDFPLDEETNAGYTAVSLAAKKGFKNIVKALRKSGADINKPDP